MTSSSEEIIRINELEKMASDILTLKAETNPRRPIVVEFCGSPKAGKSSCIGALDLFLRRNKYKTRVLTERASICPVNNKFDPFFNIWTATSAISELSEILANHPKDYDIVFLDRGIFDAICWFTWLSERNAIDEDNYTALITFLTMRKWRAVIDLIYVFTVEPKVSLEREYAYLLTKKSGSIMRPKVLNEYNNSIDNAIEKYGTNFRKVEKFDTSNVNIQDGNYKITNNVLNILLESVVEKIAYMKLTDVEYINKEIFHMNEFPGFKDARLSYNRRDKVEYDDKLLQPIPIIVITDKERTKVLVAKKKPSASGQTDFVSPEKDKTLLYFGGHVREEDSICIGTDRFLETSRCALQREIKEELNLDYVPPRSEINPLCFWIKQGDRTPKHIAVCFIMEVDFSLLKIRLDKNEFIIAGNSDSGKVLEINNLYKKYDKMEEWSRAILRNIFKYAPQTQSELLLNG